MPNTKTLTAQDLYNLTKCEHRVYLDTNDDPREKGEVGAFVKLLWELGLQTEREYLSLLGDIAVSDLHTLSIEQARVETLRLMKEGAPLIYQGCLVDGLYVGRPDLLLKHSDSKSVFGPFLHEAIDIKAGKGWQERDGKKTKFKEHYAFQVMFYRMLLKRIQGAVPPMGRIVNVDKEIEEFNPADFEIEFQEALVEAQRLVNGEATSEPVLGSYCQLCPWVCPMRPKRRAAVVAEGKAGLVSTDRATDDESCLENEYWRGLDKSPSPPPCFGTDRRDR